MNILVTGGCGFLGSNIALAALQRGDTVAVLDNLGRVGSADNLAWLRGHGSFVFHRTDVRVPEDVGQAVKASAPDVVFHLAGQVAMTTSIEDPHADFETNAGGAINVLEAVRRHAPRAVVLYSSTNKVYGDLASVRYEETATRYTTPDHPNGFDETTPLEFHSPYGCSKGAADQYVLDYARIYGLATVVFRHSTIFGERQFATFDQGWIGWFVQQALELRADPGREPFTICGNGKQVRDVLFARDLVRCYFAAVTHIGSVRGQAFNIGGGMDNSLSLLELFAFLEREIGVAMACRSLPWRASDQKVFVADVGKARALLDWQPETRCDDGLRAMIKWVDRHE